MAGAALAALQQTVRECQAFRVTSMERLSEPLRGTPRHQRHSQALALKRHLEALRGIRGTPRHQGTPRHSRHSLPSRHSVAFRGMQRHWKTTFRPGNRRTHANQQYASQQYAYRRTHASQQYADRRTHASQQYADRRTHASQQYAGRRPKPLTY